MDKLTFRVYQDPAAAYAEVVGGSLDFIDDSIIPPDQLVGEAYKNDFPDRTLRWSRWSTVGSPSRRTISS